MCRHLERGFFLTVIMTQQYSPMGSLLANEDHLRMGTGYRDQGDPNLSTRVFRATNRNRDSRQGLIKGNN